jgi:DNA-binding CsgD family transcriptional regulator
MALRALPAWLADHPVGWVLVRRTGVDDPATDWLFEEWQQLGAARLELGPLPNNAVTEVITDVLQASPDLDLLSLAKSAGGNPLLLVALIVGLRDEGSVAIAEGRARLLCWRPPQRVEQVLHDWVERLSSAARNLLEVAAFLDRSFDVDELAELLGWPAEQLLGPVRETVACDLLMTVGEDVLAFQHDLVRQSVAHRVPAAVRRALSSQAEVRLRPVCGSGNDVTAHAKEGRPSGATPESWGSLLPDQPSTTQRLHGGHDLREHTRALDRSGEGAGRGSSSEPASKRWEGLKDSERTVAELVVRGLSNRAVGERIFVSPHTVSFHLRRVYRKLGIASRVELTRLSIDQEREAAIKQARISATTSGAPPAKG